MSTPDPTATPNHTTSNTSTSPPGDPPNRSIPLPRDHLTPTPSGTILHTPPTAPKPAPRPLPLTPSIKRKGKAKATDPAVDVLSKRDHYATNPFLRIRPMKTDGREKRSATQRGPEHKKLGGTSTSGGAVREAIDPQLYQGATNSGFVQQYHAPPVVHQQVYNNPPPPQAYHTPFLPSGYNVPLPYQAPIQHPYQALPTQQGYHGAPNGWNHMPGNMSLSPHPQPPHAAPSSFTQYPVHSHYMHPQQMHYGPNAQVQQESFEPSAGPHPSSPGQAPAREQSSQIQDEEQHAKELWDKLDDSKRSQVLAIFEDMKERGQSANVEALLAVFTGDNEDRPMEMEDDAAGPSPDDHAEPSRQSNDDESMHEEYQDEFVDKMPEDSIKRDEQDNTHGFRETMNLDDSTTTPTPNTPPSCPRHSFAASPTDAGASTPGPSAAQDPSGGVAGYLLDKWHQLSRLMLERESDNREFQERLLESVQGLEKKVSRVQRYNPPLGSTTKGGRIAAGRSRPSRGMAARIVVTDRSSRPMSTADRDANDRHEKAYLNKLSDIVRKHFKFLVGFSGKNYRKMVQLSPPLTEEEFEEYELSEARGFFSRDLLQAIAGGSYRSSNVPARYITSEHITAALDTYMETCREHYRDIAAPPDPATAAKRRQRTRQNARRGMLLSSRFGAVVRRPHMERHQELFVHLQALHMSDDETDRESSSKKRLPVSYSILESEWMSLPFKGFMRTVDSMAKTDSVPDAGEHDTGGNPMRTRVVSKKVNGRAVAPSGLWRNCYSAVWLRSLKAYERRNLNIIDSDYDFTINPEPRDKDEGDDEEAGSQQRGANAEQDADMEFVQGSSKD